MANRRPGYFLDRRIVVAILGGALAACGQTGGGGMFQSGQIIGGGTKEIRECSRWRDFSRMARCSSPAGPDGRRSSTAIRPPISASTIR